MTTSGLFDLLCECAYKLHMRYKVMYTVSNIFYMFQTLKCVSCIHTEHYKNARNYWVTAQASKEIQCPSHLDCIIQCKVSTITCFSTNYNTEANKCELLLDGLATSFLHTIQLTGIHSCKLLSNCLKTTCILL